jgi:hypothetical protein
MLRGDEGRPAAKGFGGCLLNWSVLRRYPELIYGVFYRNLGS